MKTHQFVILTISFYQDKEGKWIAECEELGTSTYGSSFEEVKEEINELVTLHINTLEETGERVRFFKENDIEVYSVIPQEIEIPISVRPNIFYQPFYKELKFAS